MNVPAPRPSDPDVSVGPGTRVDPGGPSAPGLAVEAATWRPLERVELDGWWLGASHGFTRRANSVVAVGEPAVLDATLDQVEAFYAERRLPSIVRVCSGSRPECLDRTLADRGYAARGVTVVMAADIAEVVSGAALPGAADPGTPSGGAHGPLRLTSTDHPDVAWLEGWLSVKTAGGEPPDHELAARIVQASRAAYLSAADEDGPVGVLRAAFEGRWVGISCLMVRPRTRRRGVGRALTLAALGLAADTGSERAFLQVEASNEAAATLYRGLGFQVVDRYHYRERPVVSGAADGC